MGALIGSLVISILIWGGATALGGSGFFTGIANVFKYHLWFQPNPAWNAGSFGHNYMCYVFYGLWVVLFLGSLGGKKKITAIIITEE